DNQCPTPPNSLLQPKTHTSVTQNSLRPLPLHSPRCGAVHLSGFRPHPPSSTRQRTIRTGVLNQAFLGSGTGRVMTRPTPGSASIQRPSPTYANTCTPLVVTARSPGRSAAAFASFTLLASAWTFVSSPPSPITLAVQSFHQRANPA